MSLARSRLGEGGYNILHNNCEHFVNECVFGIKKSEQEEEVRRKWRLFAASGSHGKFRPDIEDKQDKNGK